MPRPAEQVGKGASPRSYLGMVTMPGRLADDCVNMRVRLESRIGLCKTELIITRRRGRNWSGRTEVERETVEWVRWYNNDRLHSSIDYLTPVEQEVMYADTIAQRVTPAVEVA